MRQMTFTQLMSPSCLTLIVTFSNTYADVLFDCVEDNNFDLYIISYSMGDIISVASQKVPFSNSGSI